MSETKTEPEPKDKREPESPVVPIKPASRLPPRALGVPVPMPTLGAGWVPSVWSRR